MSDRHDFSPYATQFSPAYTPVTQGCYALWVYGHGARLVEIGNLNFRSNWMARFVGKEHYFPIVNGILMNIEGYKEGRLF